MSTKQTVSTATPTKAKAVGYVESSTPTTNGVPHPEAPFGAVCNLPLQMQVAFHRKLLSITALQLAIVAVIASVLETSDAIMKSVDDLILSSTSMIIILAGSVLFSLALLYSMRAKHPLNWIVLGLFTAVEIVGVLTIDVALGSHTAALNCAFTWLTLTIMVALKGWTKKPRTGDVEGTVRSSYLLALVGGSAATIVFVVAGVLFPTLFPSEAEIVVSILIQICVLLWFSKEIDGMHKVMSPDEYMRGVIYLYSDLVAIAAVLVVCVAGADASGAIALGYVTDAAVANASNEEQEQV